MYIVQTKGRLAVKIVVSMTNVEHVPVRIVVVVSAHSTTAPRPAALPILGKVVPLRPPLGICVDSPRCSVCETQILSPNSIVFGEDHAERIESISTRYVVPTDPVRAFSLNCDLSGNVPR